MQGVQNDENHTPNLDVGQDYSSPYYVHPNDSIKMYSVCNNR